MSAREPSAAPVQRLGYRQRQRLAKIERVLRHAQATRSTEYESWLNSYQEDVAWLIARLRERGLT